MNVEAEFVRSAAGAADFPRDRLAEIALVGRSNVGKSSLINALVRRRIAHTSAAPGRTRLANIYRIARGSSPAFYLVDLPGYGYARGGEGSARGFEELTRAYFLRIEGRDGWVEPAPQACIAALLLVDARHPGLDSDIAAWTWLKRTVGATALVATKIDKLARGERIRASRDIQSEFGDPVLPVSAVTGEGLDELWKLIDTLSRTNPTRPRNPRSPRRSHAAPAAAPRPPKR